MFFLFLPTQALAYEEDCTVFSSPEEEGHAVYVPSEDEVYTAYASSAGIAIAPLNMVQVSTWAELSSEVTAAGSTPTTIEITDNINITATGTAWNAITIPAGSEITLTGGYAITRVSGNTQRHFVVNGTLRLENVELNGNFPLWGVNHGGIQVNAGGSVYMEDGSAIQNNRNGTGSQGGGITVTGADAALTMNGGEISGNSGGTGAGGVFVGAGALFTMTGGELSNNSITGNTGGAVSVQGAGSSFNMDGGVIRDNTGRFGGGVRVGAAGTGIPTLAASPSMHMSGGEIYDNTALFGGGVNLEWGLFTMTAGTIRNNTITSLGNPGTVAENTIDWRRGGGGVFVQNNGIFTMAGGIIQDNQSPTQGGGVILLAGTAFTMSGGEISGNTAAANGGGVAAALLNAAGNPAAGAITINMTNGIITGNTAVNGGGVWLTSGSNAASGSQLTMSGGTIGGNTAENNGGGIWLGTGIATANARLNMTGGEISNNTATNGHGGGIFTSAYVYSDPLPLTAYANILAADGVFSGNTAGVGKFAPPSNHYDFSFGELLTNYDINFVGPNPRARVTFILNGGNVSGNTADIVYSIPLGYTIGETQITPEPERLNYTLVGWTRDDNPTILSTEDVEALYVNESTTFTAQWVRTMHIVTFDLNGGNVNGNPANITHTLPYGAAIGEYNVPRPGRLNYTFTGWRHTGQAGGTPNLTHEDAAAHIVIGEITFTAQWTRTPPGGIGGQPTEPTRPTEPTQPTEPSGDMHYAYMIGFEDGKIRPVATITRAQAATIFFRLMSDADRAAFWRQDNPYSDVALTSWYNNAVSTVSNFGLFRGRPDGTFQPYGAITRAELATVIARFKGAGYSDAPQFKDIDGHWAQGYINAAALHAWVQGTDGPGGVFLPDQPVTRAEAAAMINRALNRLPESPSDLLPDMRTWPDNANPNAWYYLYIQEATNSHYYVRKANGIHETWAQIMLPERPWHLLERPDSRPQDIFRAG